MFSYSTIVLFFVYNVHNSVNRTHSNGLIGNVYARVLNIHVCGCSVKQHAPPALRASAPTPESRAQPPTACTQRLAERFTEWVNTSELYRMVNSSELYTSVLGL